MTVVAITCLYIGKTEQNKNDRISIFDNLLDNEQIVLAQGVLMGLVKDYPGDTAVTRRLQKLANEIMMQANAAEATRVAREKKWQDNYQELANQIVACQEAERIVQSKLRVLQAKTDQLQEGAIAFQTDSKLFQNQVVDYQESDRQFKIAQSAAEQKKLQTDFLYNLLAEKTNEKNLLPQQEVGNMLTDLTNKTELLNYQELMSRSAAILRADPFNIKAAIFWSYGMVKSAPDSNIARTKVLPVVEYILKDNPNDGRANQVSAIIHYFSGNYSLAETRYRQANILLPADTSIIEGYIRCLVKNQKYSDASMIARDYWRQSKKDSRTALLVWESISQDSAENKKVFLDEWHTFDPASSLPNTYLGDMAVMVDDKALAILNYEKANSLKETVRLLKQIADLSYSSSDFARAHIYALKVLASLQSTIATEKSDFIKYSRINVVSEFALHRYADVIKDGEAYLKMVGGDIPIQTDVGMSYKLNGNSEKALTVFLAIYKSGQKVLIGQELLSVYLDMKLYKEALVVCEELGTEDLSEDYRQFILNAKKIIEDKNRIVKK